MQVFGQQGAIPRSKKLIAHVCVFMRLDAGTTLVDAVAFAYDETNAVHRRGVILVIYEKTSHRNRASFFDFWDMNGL